MCCRETTFLRGRMMPLSVEEGSGASPRSKGVRMAQTGSPMGIEVLELVPSRSDRDGSRAAAVGVGVKGEEESVEASEILTETVRGNPPRLPPWWKSKRQRTRKSIHVYADSSH